MGGAGTLENMEGLKGKRILVTGGTGFVGSHLVDSLVEMGAHVIVLYRSLDPRSYFAIQKLSQKSLLVSADLKDFVRVFDLVTKYAVEYILHLGAQAIVETAYDNPRETILSNIVGTTNVLEAARLYGRVQGIVVASSDKAYGKTTKKYVETDPLSGDHPYEVSKSSTDLVAQTYAKTYGLPVIITRFGNIYGEGDLNFNRIIPGALQAMLTDTPLDIRSDGTFVRDYVYVKDVVSGYLTLLRNVQKAKGEAYNLSSNESMSVLEVLECIESTLKKKMRYSIRNTQKNEIPYQSLVFDKVKKLGYAPRYSLKKVLPGMLAWYRKVI